MINGGGAARPDLERAGAPAWPTCGSSTCSRRDGSPEVLAAGDVHVVPLKRGLARSSVPSKLYSILAAGRPIVASVDAGTEVAQIVEQRRSGPGGRPGRRRGLHQGARAPAGSPRRGGGDGRRREEVRRVLGLSPHGGDGLRGPLRGAPVGAADRRAGRFSAPWARHRRPRRWHTPPRAAAPTRPSRRRWLWPAGILLIFVVGGIVIYAARGHSHPAPTPQIANESTTTTAAPLPSSVSTPASAGATSTTTAGSSTSASTSTTVASATSSAPTSTTAKP